MAQILQAKSLSIEAHLRQGMSAAKVAAIVGVSDTMVKRHRRKLEIPAFEGKGRPAQINATLARRIVCAFKNEEFLTTMEAAGQLCSKGFTVQPPAIRTLLKTSSFTCEQEQPLKVKSNPPFWRLKKAVTKKTKNASPPVCTGVHIMVWKCFSSKGHGKIVKIVQNMDSPKYVAVLQQDLLKTLEEQNLSKSEIEFLHNNAKSHTAANTKKWLKKEGIEVINFLPYLSYLDLIENLWAYSKNKLYKYKKAVKSMRELRAL
ncbi:Homeodomain-like DNA binding domain-containing transcription factor [Phycomyces blakesleeanus NRRL 1555(-)]|uniref:Homeodomain-like DNA binding domain-containing transcription factor n=1 Tax=Phycomyces blakesleeanus (strain ATCC 8743b / DSM 1359 / FGSC 10004 / NBRC 33097 / NRRL 1555) TaxID=763407 RepID=A0A167KB06_PHYB8|nr:Homeodomain-like DNA binding domain-containing transcription factor [Phycomyces blakesleeanus NRRL 1555(-)]OAD67649.1 Homeodomain-like DNA binding domain-containing transcription factor [Phycomyces blakesleeanus NRRL 1555(-)]|eukprot:XP_018285689.1 Homeodomain-like DNA binding domain-containing transcription factor [Phycomyces blakesleeanus NRRL 1555(-)]